MSKNLTERIKKDRENLIKKTWSKSYFVDLLTDYINEPEFESHVIEMQKDDAGKEVAKAVKSYPIKKFRKTLKNILMDFGVDATDAEKIVTDYKFKKKDVETMYDFMTDFIYLYLESGRKLQLFKKEDAALALIMEEKDPYEKDFEGNEKRAASHVKYKKHKKVRAESKCPDWLKTSYSADKKEVLKQVALMYEE